MSKRDRVVICTSDGTNVGIKNVDDESLLDLVDDLHHGESTFLVFDLDAGDTVYVNRSHITRVEINADE